MIADKSCLFDWFGCYAGSNCNHILDVFYVCGGGGGVLGGEGEGEEGICIARLFMVLIILYFSSGKTNFLPGRKPKSTSSNNLDTS